MEFTNNELTIISNSLLNTMKCLDEVSKSLYGTGDTAIAAVEEMKELKKLNDKVCSFIKE